MTGLTKPCPDCGGEGSTWGWDEDGPCLDYCWECNGSGRVPVLESELEAAGQLNVLTEE